MLDANKVLKGAKIAEVFSQERGTLIVHCKLSDENIFAEFCVVPGNAHLTLKKNYSRAKKNTVNFFEEAIGDVISSFLIADDDRIVKISCEQSTLFFAIRGKYTNIFCMTKANQIIPFKSVKEELLEQTKAEFAKKTFISGWNKLDLEIGETDNYPDEIRKKYPVLGKDIIMEFNARSNNPDKKESIILLESIIEEIRMSKPCILIDEELREINLGFENFKSLSFTEKKIFDDIFEAENFLLSKQFYLNARQSKLKLINNHLDRELNKVTDKINKIRAIIDRGTRVNELNKLGNLLLANLGLIKRGMTSITVEDIFTSGESITIKLNPKLSSQKNVDLYFDKSRAEKAGFTKSKELITKAESEYKFLRQAEDSLNNNTTIKELELLMKKLKIKPSDQKETDNDISSKFKQYKIDGKYKIFVGRDSKNNDLLTTKFAKQNDYWFHARGVSGSHVVLRVDNAKEAVPKNILKKAAALAAYHSKAKTSGITPVAFTFKKYVVKKKGDSAGTVHLLREDVLLVKPEIPDGCEFISLQERQE